MTDQIPDRIFDFLQEIAARPRLHDVLRTVVFRVAKEFQVQRASVVFFEPSGDVAYVVTDQDNERLENLVIRLSDYPELIHMRASREPVIISDVLSDSLLAGVRSKIERANVAHRGAVLFPLHRDAKVIGALFLRSNEPISGLNDQLLTLGRVIAAATAIAVGHALEHEDLVSRTKQLERTSEEVNEQLEGMKHWLQFFERATDGIVVTDASGTIQYANNAACGILGRLEAELVGRLFVSVLHSRSTSLADRALRGDSLDSSGYIDLVAETSSNPEVVISVAIQPMKDPPGAFISFRDVTELREIENELRQTKEFLENVIQSSVDGIIVADIDGQMVLINRAAEQILGYSARHVVGKLGLEDIYPSGELREVMRRCRSESHGGRGRLQSLRTTLVARDSSEIPVNLSAALIYEGSEEVAIVSIFSDLREREKLEEKLQRIQRRLQMSERQVVAMELAGTAAHELNQPLTSILGYAAMLKRRAPENPLAAKAIDTIYRETERMAAIVKRLGQVTSYETKPYVGHSTILDLAQSAGPSTRDEPGNT